jgi:hypothetical protein
MRRSTVREPLAAVFLKPLPEGAAIRGTLDEAFDDRCRTAESDLASPDDDDPRMKHTAGKTSL